MSDVPHIPVLVEEVLSYLAPQEKKVYVDGTFGCGGYSKAILDKAACSVIAIDQDREAEAYAIDIQKKYSEKFHFIQGNFKDLKNILKREKISSVDGIVLDLGVSSPQLNMGERGFSFNKEGPLDMRMGSGSLTATEVLQVASLEKLADIFFYLGGEQRARSIARAIVARREKEGPLKTTTELAELVRRVVKGGTKIDPATRTFQGLRIYVNDELGSLQAILEEIPSLLAPKGRVVIVTFHSLEDRLVKNFFKQLTACVQENACYFTLLTPQPILPSKTEVRENPRSRSAKLRAIQRTDIQIPQNFLEIIKKNQHEESQY